MANQIDVDKYHYHWSMRLETAAKLRAYVKGKKYDKPGRMGYRALRVADVIEKCAEDVTKDVTMDEDSRKWMEEQYLRNCAIRVRADKDVRSGKFRKAGKKRKVSKS